ncbi:MAG TPA: hypothetical protein VMV46_17600 [Thermoanaerobaculia bacterium]|nr:hypothetical protein [Thermoanaerobaculia bacterium]
MKTLTLTRSRPAIALAAALALASAGFAQTASQSSPEKTLQTSTDTWRDQIGPNDVRVLGKVAEVREETFTLRAQDATYIFEIPSDSEQSAAVRTGNDVQVWYDPAGYDRDGDTYYRVSYLNVDDQTAQVTYRDPAETSQSESELAASAELEAEATVAETESFEAEATVAETEDFEAEAELQVAESESFAAEPQVTGADSEDEQALPATAGSLPLVALGGLIALLGAVALRLRLS